MKRAYFDQRGVLPRWTSPLRFAAAVTVVLLVWIASASIAPADPVISERAAVIRSCAAAVVVWLGTRALVCGRCGDRTVLALEGLAVTKVALGLAHFFWVFLPAAGVQGSERIGESSFTGDMASIHAAAQLFTDEFASDGLPAALFGEYYRGINNPGVGVVYGLMYASFGGFPSVAFPWNALAMLYTAVLLRALGDEFGCARRASNAVAVFALLMPTFLVGPPNYRDQFMVFFLALQVYAASRMVGRQAVVNGLVLGWAATVLVAFRTAYVAVPFVAIACVATRRLGVRASAGRWFGPAAALCAAAAVAAYSGLGPEFVERASGTRAASDAGVSPALAGAGGVGRLLFMLLTPMPWHQSVDPALLAYQVFDYAQTAVSLTVIGAVVLSVRRLPATPGLRIFLAGAAVFFLALNAQELHQRYAQIALPLIALGASELLVRSWRSGAVVSGVVILCAHVALLVVR